MKASACQNKRFTSDKKGWRGSDWSSVQDSLGSVCLWLFHQSVLLPASSQYSPRLGLLVRGLVLSRQGLFMSGVTSWIATFWFGGSTGVAQVSFPIYWKMFFFDF